jgi:predicted nucleic acid-binding protein
MTYLVDATVLSEPTRQTPNSNVVAWLLAHEEDVVIDSIVLAELCAGVLALPVGRRRARLEQWFALVAETVDCLPWDAGVARRWAALVVELRKNGRTLPLLDGMIAATALDHGLTVATRNTRDFAKTGVEVFDPFLPLSAGGE